MDRCNGGINFATPNTQTIKAEIEITCNECSDGVAIRNARGKKKKVPKTLSVGPSRTIVNRINHYRASSSSLSSSSSSSLDSSDDVAAGAK